MPGMIIAIYRYVKNKVCNNNVSTSNDTSHQMLTSNELRLESFSQRNRIVSHLEDIESSSNKDVVTKSEYVKDRRRRMQMYNEVIQRLDAVERNDDSRNDKNIEKFEAIVRYLEIHDHRIKNLSDNVNRSN